MNRACVNRLLIVLVTILGPVSELRSAPVDLSPPKNTVGSADGDGYLRYVHRFGDIVFSDNFSIPLRFDFSSRRVVEGTKSEFGWHGWNCGAIEAMAVVRDSGLLDVQLLCAKILSLGPVTGQPGNFISADRSWKGEVEGEMIVVKRDDGWILRFLKGKVDYLRTDKGKEIRWTYDEAGHLQTIQVAGTELPQLSLSWSEDGRPLDLKIESKTYSFRFGGQFLSSINWTLSSGEPRSFDLVQNENSLQINTSSMSRFRFSWDPKNGIILSDGENRYTLKESRVSGQAVGLRVLAMTEPDGSVITHELGSSSGETRYITADGREIVATRVVSDTAANGAIDRVEWLRESQPALILMKNFFDAEGKIVRRLWLGDAVTHRGYDSGSINPALFPARETLYPIEDINSEAAMTMIEFDYTAIDQLRSVRVGGKEVIRFDFDSENRLVLMHVNQRYEKSFSYEESGSVVESLAIPQQKDGTFWYLESSDPGIDADLVLSSEEDSDGRLISKSFADGRRLLIEYDTGMRRIMDRTIAADGQTEVERVTYVHSPADGTAMRIRENLLTGTTDYADISIMGIGSDSKGRKIPWQSAAKRAGVLPRE